MRRDTAILVVTLLAGLLANPARAGDAVVELGVGDGFVVKGSGGEERFRVNESGQVGIGTTNPSNPLTVVGTIESTLGGFEFPDGSVQTSAASVVTTVFTNNCKILASFDESWAKITDFGTFTKLKAGSAIEVTYNGRIAVIDPLNANGARFELRVSNAPTSNGWARAAFKAAEVGNDGIPVSITGIFTGLGSGAHTVSIWVQAVPFGSGTRAFLDPGCWSSDHIIVKEY